jgi:hypothetical protein
MGEHGLEIARDIAGVTAERLAGLVDAGVMK